MTTREILDMIDCAIIGCGRIGSEFEFILDTNKPHSHAGAYSTNIKTRLAYGIEVNVETAEKFVDRWGVECYDSVQSALSAEPKVQIECVSICTSPEHHLKLIKDCISCYDKLKVIWCEKPLGQSALEAEKIISICQENNIEIFVNTWRKWDYLHDEIKKTVSSGLIGKVQGIFAQCHVGLVNTGVHMLSLIQHYTDSAPTSVFGKIHSDGSEDPGASGIVEFDKGFHVFFDNLWKENQRFGVIIQGDKGRIEAFSEKTLLSSFDIFTLNKKRRVVRSRPDSPMQEAVQKMVSFIESGKKTETEKNSVKKSMETVAAFYQSSELGKKVELPVSKEYYNKKLKSRLTSLTKDGKIP